MEERLEGCVARLGDREPMDAAAEDALVRRAQAGDRAAREALVEHLLPLIGAVARSYRTGGAVQRVELLQEGVLGVLRARSSATTPLAACRSGATPPGGCARRCSSSSLS